MNIKIKDRASGLTEALFVISSAVLFYQAKSSRRLIKDNIPVIPLYALKPAGGPAISAGTLPEISVISVAARNLPLLS